MRKINSYSLILYIVICLYICLSFCLFLPNISGIYFNYINPMFWLCLFVLSFFLFKNDICRKRYKYDFLQIVIISVIVYLIIFYLFGLIVGYNRLPYNHSVLGITKNLCLYALIIFPQEYIRQALINRSGKKRYLLIIITAIFACVNIINLTNGFVINDITDIFKLVYTIMIAETTKSILLTYLTYKSDFIPSFVYAFVLQVIIYIIPITPDLNWFLDGTFKLLLPFIVYILCSSFYAKRELLKSRKKQMYFTLTPLLIIIIPIIILVSGVFKYQIIAIGSNSMHPTYKRGDAVVFEKLENKEMLEEKDIIVFEKDGVIVLHRIIKIEYTEAGNRKYITKGDNNNIADEGFITDEDIIGVYKFKIYKIGYPSVWLQELIY